MVKMRESLGDLRVYINHDHKCIAYASGKVITPMNRQRSWYDLKEKYAYNKIYYFTDNPEWREEQLILDGNELFSFGTSNAGALEACVGWNDKIVKEAYSAEKWKGMKKKRGIHAWRLFRERISPRIPKTFFNVVFEGETYKVDEFGFAHVKDTLNRPLFFDLTNYETEVKRMKRTKKPLERRIIEVNNLEVWWFSTNYRMLHWMPFDPKFMEFGLSYEEFRKENQMRGKQALGHFLDLVLDEL